MSLTPSGKALVPFISVDDMMKIVRSIGLRRVLHELTDAIEADFLRWESFDKVARVASHSAQGVIELMPTSDGEVYGFKYVNGHPGNTASGHQTVTAFGMLADVATGYPVLLSEMTLLTALRTAATSAMAARALAPAGARVMAMIGNGAQSEFQSLALQAVCGITDVRLYDTDVQATRKCAANLAGSGLTVVQCASAQEAIQGAQIITTCTADKKRATILSENMVGAGVHINAIGGDCPGKTELAPAVLDKADVFVEFAPQTRIEGDIQQMDPDFAVHDLWRVLDKSIPGRTSEAQITVFDSVGFAIEDFSALKYMLKTSKSLGLSAPLDMLADPDDPRDLFGMLQRSGGSAPASAS